MRVFGRFTSVILSQFSAKKAIALVVLVGLVVFSCTATNIFKPALTLATPSVATPAKLTSHKATQKIVVKAAPQSKPAAVKSCTSASIPALSPIVLKNSSPSLTQLIASPKMYTVNGNNMDQVRSQLAKCAPKDAHSGKQFLGDTSYSLSWSFDMSLTNDGLCHVSRPQVAIVIRQILPSLNNVSGNASLATAWQTFIANLKTHENGHSKLDQQYAQQILSLLKSMPSQKGCKLLKSSGTTAVNKKLQALEQANIIYDQKTNHGATQGATF